MSPRWVTPLLVTLCIGGVIASGVFSARLQGLSEKIEAMNVLLTSSERTLPVGAQMDELPSRNNDAQILSLQREMAALREALLSVKAELSRSVAAVPIAETEVDEEQFYVRQEKEQALSVLVSDALGRGYWSQTDAEAFRNESIGLSPQAVSAIASDIIRAIEEGKMEMPDDLMIPF